MNQKTRRYLWYFLAFLGIFAVVRWASAQAVVQVNYDTAVLTWTAPAVCDANGQPAGCGGAPDVYHVKCSVRNGAALPVFDVPAPTTSVAVKVVVPAPGSYECLVTAENAFPPESGPSNVLPFDVGRPSGSPTNLNLGVGG